MVKIELLDRARSYLTGGKRAQIVHAHMPTDVRILMLNELDANTNSKINSMSNVELIHLIERVLGDSLEKSLEAYHV